MEGFSLNPHVIASIFHHARPLGHNEDPENANLGFGFLYYGIVRALRPNHVLVIGSGFGFRVVCLALGLKDNSKGRLTFVGEEITTYFPEDGCKLHVLAYGIRESQHEDISRIRENVFDLVNYLNDQGILHALAHPLYAVNEMLTERHFCLCLLLFKTFELNGARDQQQNRLLRDILGSLTQEDLLLRFIDRALLCGPVPERGFMNRVRGAICSRRRGKAGTGGPFALKDMLLKEGREIVLRDPQMQRLLRKGNSGALGICAEGPEVWFRFVNEVSDRVLKRFADSILETLSGGNVFDIFQSLGSAGSLYTLLAPFFVAYAVFTKDRRFCRRCSRHLKKQGLSDLPATFTGILTGEDLAQAYASSDLFQFPSTTDTFGNVVLEAQASGLPVIVTDEGGPQENLIHGRTGLIVPANDMEAFVGAIVSLIDDPESMARMRRQARENSGWETWKRRDL